MRRYTIHPVNMTVQVCDESGRVLCSCDDPNDAVLIAACVGDPVVFSFDWRNAESLFLADLKRDLLHVLQFAMQKPLF
jgi:hypothetical protein